MPGLEYNDEQIWHHPSLYFNGGARDYQSYQNNHINKYLHLCKLHPDRRKNSYGYIAGLQRVGSDKLYTY